MDTSYPYVDNEHHFCSLEKSVADYGARNLVATGDGVATLLQKVGAASCDILTKVGETECSVIDKISSVNMADFKDRSDIAQRQAAALNQVERDLQNRVHENRQIIVKEIADQTASINGQAKDSYIDIKNQLSALALDQANKFAIAALEQAKSTAMLQLESAKQTASILETLGRDKYDNMKDKIDALREECERGKWLHGLALQNAEITSLKNMVNSVDQNQRFASKTVQFGTGNTAGTAQTANQG